MNATLIGIIFILTGMLYGSLALDKIYNATLGWLINNRWLEIPKPPAGVAKNFFGRKPTILLYSFGLITLGLFIILKLK